ncbi:MAG: DUF4097 family beta strand repeat protein [Pyrinomonadaceae bacterium]|nr:DUF4097 family beta strand repeat protein [Pyrinomonadaceae bacterium]
MKTTYKIILLMICISLFSCTAVFGQSRKTEDCNCKEKEKKAKVKTSKKVKPKVLTVTTSLKKRGFGSNRVFKRGNDFTEKSIDVNSKVLVQLCVLRGKVKINGWKRKEVRAFIGNGGSLGFKVRQKAQESGKPTWVDVLGYDLKDRSGSRGNKCLSGDVIELDVPVNTEVKIEGQESEISVDSIRRAYVHNHGGSIFVDNVKDGVDARTHQGDVSLRRSNGRIYVSTTSGNVVAFKTDVNEIGDYFKAKSQSGAITLQSVEQRELEVRSTSGTINYLGKLNSGGQYTFYTSNGSITLGIPKNSSFQATVSSSAGKFDSDIQLKDVDIDEKGGFQRITGRAGTGDSVLYLTTYNGSIRIRKIDPDPKP